MSENKKRARGRPTEYREDLPERAYELCKETGLTDAQLAKAFGVGKSTLYSWKRTYPEFADRIADGKDEYDTNVVEASLLKRAKGFTYTEITKEPVVVRSENGNKEIIGSELAVVRKVTKYVPPDPTSMIYWLKNRNPHRWRDRKEVGLDFEKQDGLVERLKRARDRVCGVNGDKHPEET